jgi:hypothetical protein
MKAETRDKYLNELYGLDRQVRSWVDEFGDTQGEALVEFWGKIKEVQNDLMDGVDIDTVYAKNRITALNTSVQTWKRRLYTDSGENDAETVSAEPDTVPSDMGKQVIEALADIQATLEELYGSIVEKHPLASSVPAIGELKIRSAEIGSTMQKISKLAGVL